jgi:hypothetical protein
VGLLYRAETKGEIMKRFICTSALALLMTTTHGQQSGVQSTPAQSMPPGLENRQQLPPGLQNRDQLPPGLAGRSNANASAAANGAAANGTAAGGTMNSQSNLSATGTSNGVAGQLPQTGRESAGASNQSSTTSGQTGTRTDINGSVQFHVNAVTTTDQPIATQVQQVLIAEPVLAQTLPTVQIQVNNGAVILDGSVQCGAERVLIENLVQQRLPRTVRIENRLRPPGGAFAPATYH